MHGFDINGVNNVTGTGSIKLTTTTPPKEESFYPGLTLNYEARMQNEMENSSFMQGLNELFGI